MTEQLRVVSFGGGVQSTALLVLAAQGRIDYQTFLFCNVGEDSENPRTLEYITAVSRPYAERHGLALVELKRQRKDGRTETLHERLMKDPTKNIPIPVRLTDGVPGKRACTADFKVRVVSKWLRQHGARPKTPAMVALGISLDELHRARTASGIAWETLDYPLITLRLSRENCEEVIREAGLPVPPRSACYFCPMRSLKNWQALRSEDPELFEKSVRLERAINERRASHGLYPVWFSRRCKPLDVVTTDHRQGGLFTPAMEETEVCESGYCFV